MEINKFDHNKMMVYIINLDNSTQRFEYAKNFVDMLGYNYQRISAVNGNNLNENDIIQIVDLDHFQQYIGRYPKRGEIGCYLSHIKVWHEFLKSDNEFALILEDDISFDSNKFKQLIDFLIKNKKLWDIVSLVTNEKNNIIKIKNWQDNYIFGYLHGKITNSGAMLINKKAAERMMVYSSPMKLPFDRFYTRNWEFGLKLAGISPQLAPNYFGDSEIGKSKLIKNGRANFSKAIYSFKTKLTSYIYNYWNYYFIKNKKNG